MLKLSNTISLATNEIELHAIRAQGNGGQRVNKVSTAIHLRFDIAKSSLPEIYKHRLLQLSDQRISRDGIVVIKSQSYRTQEQNREAALQRLKLLILDVMKQPKVRRMTKPSKGAQQRRMDTKGRRGDTKKLRQKVRY